MTRAARSLVVLVTALSFATSGISCGGAPPSSVDSRPTTPPASPAPAAPGTPTALADLNIPPDTLVQAGTQLLKSVPADEYDVAAAAKSIGNDVARTFSFVRDNLAFDPYAGSLRGATGALMVRAGNAVDRSLLLAALLEANGHKVRLVQGTLDADAVERLRVRSKEPPVAATPSAMDLPTAAKASGLSDAALRSLVETADALAQKTRADVDSRVKRRMDAIVQQLKGAGIQLSPAAAAQTDVLARHVWVQVLVGTAWQDLDTTFRDARPGQSFCKPEGAPIQMSALPAEWYHTLRVRVLVSRPGGATPEVTLDHELRIATIVLQPLAIAFVPQGGLDPYQATSFQPALMAGSAPVSGTAFDLGLPKLGARGGSFFGALSGDDGGGENVVVGVGLELTLKAPGAAPKQMTRQIVGPATTQDVALRGTEIRDQLVSLYHIAAGVGPLPFSLLARLQMALTTQLAGSSAPDQPVVPLDLMNFVGIVASGDGQAGNGRRYYAQPFLVAQRTRFGGAPGGSRTLIRSLDILHNRMEFIDGDPLASVRQGVFETELERAAFPGGEVVNTSTVFDRATSGVEVIRPREPGKLNNLAFNEDAKLRIVEDLEAGFVVIVPNANVTIAGQPALGWWRVHPLGGETLGRMHSGEGQSTTGYVLSIIPSGWSFLGTVYCNQKGRTDGWCNPCLLGALGILGSGISMYGWAVSSNTLIVSIAKYAWVVGTGAYGGITKGLSCIKWLTDGKL